MSAFAVQATLLRQPWQQRRHSRLWWLTAATPLLLALPVLAIAALRSSPLPSTLAALGLLWLVWLWWLQAEGLFQQNRPLLALLLPGHAMALRWSLALQGLLTTLLAAALLGLALGWETPLRWLWLSALVVLALAWLAREPWLWLPFGIASPWLGELRGLTLQLSVLPLSLQALLLAAMTMALVLCVGRGGALHRGADARQARWQSTLAAMREDRSVPTRAQSRLDSAMLLLVAWPIRLWRRRLLQAGAQAPLLARLDMGLDSGGRWTQLLWIGVLAALTTFAILVHLTRHDGLHVEQLVGNGRIGLGIGAFALISGALHGRLARLWARRREQALLVLLPGAPHSGDTAALERRWRREWLQMWAVASAVVLAVGALGPAGTLNFLAVCVAVNLPLVWLAQWLQRRLDGPPRLLLLGLAPPLAAVLGGVAERLEVPAAVSLALGVLVYALCAWWQRQHKQAPGLRLPLGRGVS